MAGIFFEQIGKTYPDGFTAVHDFTLEIPDGEFVVLVGPSGCGKTTTLRMVAGLETITSGTLRIGDRFVNDLPPKDRDIAMVFQNYALYPHMTVAENMGFALRMQRVPRPERRSRVEEAAEMLGIGSILKKKPGQLSGGQRQRVALGRAIVRQPAAFLFDEPLSNLDPDRRVATRAEIRRIQRRLKTTVIYVTHDHEEAMALGDTIVVMKDGVVQQAGPPEEVYRSPANLFVGQFLGAPRMNALSARVVKEGGSVLGEIRLGPVASRLAILAERLPDGVDHGASVSLGIRPMDLHIAPVGADTPGAIEGTVIDAEPLGFAVDYRIDAGDALLVVRAPSETALLPGSRVALSAQPESIQVFPAEDVRAQVPEPRAAAG